MKSPSSRRPLPKRQDNHPSPNHHPLSPFRHSSVIKLLAKDCITSPRTPCLEKRNFLLMQARTGKTEVGETQAGGKVDHLQTQDQQKFIENTSEKGQTASVRKEGAHQGNANVYSERAIVNNAVHIQARADSQNYTQISQNKTEKLNILIAIQ